MNVIVHYPESQESLCELQKVVAGVHAEAVLRYINNISCPKEQKLKMLNEIIEKGLQ